MIPSTWAGTFRFLGPRTGRGMGKGSGPCGQRGWLSSNSLCANLDGRDHRRDGGLDTQSSA
jgi:hypothetical protein